ncbi:MAG: ABC transporter permease [Lachnospiraceae bacterium]|nr:ABC transporter permease [Lachnospiraceae bacterium]
MSKFFYLKLALTNLKKNKNTYIPYIIAGIGTVFTFLMLLTISDNKGFESMRGADTLRVILNFGAVVVGVFAAGFLFYANGFLFKKRKKELGLYSILGLERKHIARVLFHETMLVALISIGGGMIVGLVFGKLSFLLLLNIMNISTIFPFTLGLAPVRNTVILFGALYLAVFVDNVVRLRFTKVINMLHGEEEGEKEPKTSLLRAILGVICLGTAYYIAITVKSPLSAITLFFVAVLLVIAGTFLLFSAGSIAVLKTLKKNKKFYYKSKNFISVSGMIYRMKQNAKGLANICILSTMVIVMISGTTALYFGQEDSLRYRYPFDIIAYNIETDDTERLDSEAARLAAECNITIDRTYFYHTTNIIAKADGNTFVPGSYRNINMSEISSFYDVSVITAEEYDRMEGTNTILAEDEALIFMANGVMEEDTMNFGDMVFQIKQNLDDMVISEKRDVDLESTMYMIVKDQSVIDAMKAESIKHAGTDDSILEKSKYCFNINGDVEDKMDFATAFNTVVRAEGTNQYMESLDLNRDEWFSTFGGLLFLGVFLGLIFMMATVMIIYFKQISEGYQDRSRFIIMQKVGMSHSEVRGTIKKQILMVFFLPLITAFIHMAFAFPMITRVLIVFGLLNNTVTLMCTLITVLAFALIYILVYALTARAYYKLVS